MVENKQIVLIIEDDADMARLNARLLIRRGYDVRIANTASEARALINEISPDLFVLDIGLPDGNGLDLCKEFREKSDAPLLFLTGRTGADDKISGLDSGGDYYLTKPYDTEEFIAIVRSLLRRANQTREKIAEATVITKGSLTLKLDERKAFVGGRDAQLSTKEFSVLLLLVQNEDKELKYEYLYEAVWGVPMLSDSSALRQQISRMKRKLDEENAADFSILNEQGKGYTFTMF